MCGGGGGGGGAGGGGGSSQRRKKCVFKMMLHSTFSELNRLRLCCENLIGCNHISILIWSNCGAIWFVSCRFSHYNILQADCLVFMCFIKQKIEYVILNRKLLSAEVILKFL